MFSTKLRELRNSNGYSMDKLIDIYNKEFNGKMNKSTLSRYENGLQEPIYTVVVNLAKLFNVSIDYLSTDDDKYISPNITEETTTFPVIGEIAAGYEHIALEDWSGETVEIPNTYLRGRNKEEFFVLKVKGDSMYPQYQEGDFVLILKQTTLDRSGDIGTIIYDGECATLKKIEFVAGEDWLEMIPLNPEYKPKRIEGPDLELCKIIGVPKLLIREIN